MPTHTKAIPDSYEGPAPVRIPASSAASHGKGSAKANANSGVAACDESLGDVCPTRIAASSIGAGGLSGVPSVTAQNNFGLGSNSDLNHVFQNNHLEDMATRYRNQRSVPASRMLMDCCRIGPSVRADGDAGRDAIMLADLEDDMGRDVTGAAGAPVTGRGASFMAGSGRGPLGTDGGGSMRQCDPLCGSMVVSGACFFSPRNDEEGGAGPEVGHYTPPAQGFEKDLRTETRTQMYSSPTRTSAIGTNADGNFLRMSCYRRGE